MTKIEKLKNTIELFGGYDAEELKEEYKKIKDNLINKNSVTYYDFIFQKVKNDWNVSDYLAKKLIESARLF